MRFEYIVGPALLCATLAVGQPVLPPVPLHDGVTIVPAHPREDAEGAGVDALLGLAADGGTLSSGVAVVRASELPAIAKERVLLALILSAGESGGSGDLPALEELSTETPEAVYMAPLCKRDHPHIWFPYAAEAPRAAFAIRGRIAADAISAAGSEEERRRMLIDMIGSDRGEGELYGAALQWFREGGASFFDGVDGLRPYDYTELLLAARDAESPAALREIGGLRTAPQAVRVGALSMWNGLETDSARRAAHFAASLDGDSAREDWEVSLAIGMLGPRDAAPDLLAKLGAMLGDPATGADAAAALVRLDREGAVLEASAILDSRDADRTKVRRAVLMLLDADTAESRTALERWLARKDGDASLASMRGEVSRWIAE